jgi:hypothetical protein
MPKTTKPGSNPREVSVPAGLPLLLTTEQLCEYWSCCARTIDRYCDSRALAHMKIAGRRFFRVEDVLQFMENRRLGA